MKYPIDIIFCIDTSIDMENAVSSFKKRASQFYPDIKEALSAASKEVSQIRIKLILFGPNGSQTYLKESDWFYISNSKGLDNEYFSAALNHIKCKDYFEKCNGLEALALAIKSDWVQVNGKCRQIIAMFTNHSAEKLEEMPPKRMICHEGSPTSLEELTDLWMTPYNPQLANNMISLKQLAKRLVLFSPEAYPWQEIYESWDQVVYNPSKAGTEFDDVSYEDIINAIVGSV